MNFTDINFTAIKEGSIVWVTLGKKDNYHIREKKVVLSRQLNNRKLIKVQGNDEESFFLMNVPTEYAEQTSSLATDSNTDDTYFVFCNEETLDKDIENYALSEWSMLKNEIDTMTREDYLHYVSIFRELTQKK